MPNNNHPLSVNGAWAQLLTDWLDKEQLVAPELRHQLDGLRPTDRINVSLWQKMLEEAVGLKPEAVAPVVDIGQLVQPRHVGLLGYLVLSCQTLAEALVAYHRYESLFYNSQVVEVFGRGDYVRVSWPKHVSAGELSDVLSFVAIVAFLRRLVTEQNLATKVGFVLPQPNQETYAALTAYFGCHVLFEQNEFFIDFPVTHLSQPLHYSDTGLTTLLNRQNKALLNATLGADPFEYKLQQVIARLLPENRASLKEVAEQVHVSVRTLQRRLSMRGLHWQKLLDSTRMALAEEYFADQNLSLADIALLLGFSEQSAFSRAYQNWTGQPPGKVRNQRLGLIN